MDAKRLGNVGCVLGGWYLATVLLLKREGEHAFGQKLKLSATGSSWKAFAEFLE